MDQIAALEWVRDNIAAFGGDPNGGGRPIWPAFVVAEERVLMLDEDIEPGVLPNNAALDVFDGGTSRSADGVAPS